MTDIPVGRGILDTSTVILLGRLTDPAALPTEPLITAVTLAELSVGPLVTADSKERAARQARLQQAEPISNHYLSTRSGTSFWQSGGMSARRRTKSPSAFL